MYSISDSNVSLLRADKHKFKQFCVICMILFTRQVGLGVGLWIGNIEYQFNSISV